MIKKRGRGNAAMGKQSSAGRGNKRKAWILLIIYIFFLCLVGDVWDAGEFTNRQHHFKSGRSPPTFLKYSNMTVIIVVVLVVGMMIYCIIVYGIYLHNIVILIYVYVYMIMMMAAIILDSKSNIDINKIILIMVVNNVA